MPTAAARRRWERLIGVLLALEVAGSLTAITLRPTGMPGSCTVVNQQADEALAKILLRECQAALPRVTAVWGTWSRRAVIVLPTSTAELSRLLPGIGDLGQVAAVARAERIFVNPSAFGRLSERGRRVVITHEVTHLATWAPDAHPVPSWLVEGTADYVGYLHAGVPLALASQELAVEVRAGRLPVELPSDAAFDGTDLPAVYEQSWLAVSLLVSRRGQPALVRLYRAVRSGTALDQAMREDFGFTLAQFTAAWRNDLSRQLA